MENDINKEESSTENDINKEESSTENDINKEEATSNEKNVIEGGGCMLAFIIGFVVIFFILLLIPSRPEVKDELDYEVMAMQAIKENLKDPYSAEFLETEVNILEDDKALVILKVRAKNSFNAYVVTTYAVAFDGDNYRIAPLE